MRKLVCFIALLCVIVTLSSEIAARSFESIEPRTSNSTALSPAYCNAQHNIGKIVMSVSNDGTFGNGWSLGGQTDCFTGRSLRSCEFPKGSQTTHLWAADLWIGAIVGTDTLVSTAGMGGHEFHPDEPPIGEMQYRSNIDPTRPNYVGAVSEQDYIAVYADTCNNCQGLMRDELDGRNHIPLNVEVTQRSFAWSYPHTEDFVLINYEVKNIGSQPLQHLYVGLHADADVHQLANPNNGWEDDLTGFLELAPASYLPPTCWPDSDVVNLAWVADNEGGLYHQGPFPPTLTVAATRLLGAISWRTGLSYNWWVRPPEDYGPQAHATNRDLVVFEAQPLGDRNKYHFLSNGEVDFDQPRLATIAVWDSSWVPPPEDKDHYAMGLDIRYLLSLGPFDIEPGQSLRFALAYVCGEDFHTVGDNFLNLPYNPDAWYENVDFTDLSMNAIWAEWVYDNPGVDTDSDGYRGEFTICDPYGSEDTVWRRGDGVPDYSATSLPPTPIFWVEPGERAIRVRWNGLNAETTVDWFSHDVEFEGYNAYLSTTGSTGSFSRIGSYDIDDYYKYHWDFDRAEWVGDPHPYRLIECRCLYAYSCNDSTWHPMDYSRQTPYVVQDSVLYFEPVLANASAFGLETPFIKRFPAAPKPPVLDADSIRALFPNGGDTLYLTDDDYFKYYEYEFTIDNLLPGQTYWVTITSFEYGTHALNIAPAESDIVSAAKTAIPLSDSLCCVGRVGDVNGEDGDEPTLGDVVLLIDGLFITANPASLPCLLEADVNQSGGASATPDDITIGDIAYLIDYLFITGSELGLADCL